MATSPSQRNPIRQNSLASSQQDIAAHLLEAAAQASAAQESSEESGPEDDSPEAYKDGSGRPEKRRKRARACVACRNMKIRCNPVEGQEACLACSKVNRGCIMPGPAKKRQKTVHKVAELEKKINALTQSLLAKNQAGPTPQQSPVVTDGSQSTKEQIHESPELKSYPLFTKSPIPPPRQQPVESNYEDVIDRGIISFAMADRIFDKFVLEMNPLCPLVAFQPSTTFESVRRRRPMLCLAILASGAPALLPEAHDEVAEELARQLGNRMYFLFERSIDLVQASLILTTWVGKHKSAKDMGFNQYIHGAVVMAHDLGLSKRLKIPLTKDLSEEAEMRRTWLSCYYSALSVSCMLRHPPMVRTTPYLQDCLNFFAKSPAALPTDAILCSFVRLLQIMEDVACSFHMDDPASVVRLEDSSTQYSLKLFEQRIEDWRHEAKRRMEPKLLDFLTAVATIYSHEIALHTDHNVDDFRPPAGRPGSAETPNITKDFVTPSHLDALTKAVVAMRSALDTFISIFPTSGVRALPCLFIVWTAYAVVAMIRLDGALRSSKSRYAEVFLPDLKIEYYLDIIVERLSNGKPEAGATCAPVPMFVHAFQKLRLWHQYRLVGGVGPEFADLDNPKTGIENIRYKMDEFVASKERPNPNSSNMITKADGSIGIVENAMIGAGPIDMLRQQRGREQQASAISRAGVMPNAQGFDAHGGSWLTNSSMPIDASLFENQDWNFTLEDWNNFEASMVQPAGSSWLGYLL
ncbi:hypothetical protein H2198_001769 [Neophaeococcomyces mojaviensis]|uniref:Uncharacterized protein n=1 Tax=Neophaeococcomyces mojaviensis TaxID=3383035 RepID=A0ACC3AGS7_9EURO|nr:hypothetical protein H2198_001769 [Knufia sp. JES_112]